MPRLDTDRLTLLWVCPECKQQFKQSLSEIPEAGLAVCPECEAPCELGDWVLYQAPGKTASPRAS